ncbi:MAG: hypothetical protein KKE20_02695, partial [Nanoarchaeota archaeon]|nr:hypothetical protein [Nanoarchaeota archaeon]
QDVLEDLCGDFDGCDYIIGMKRWSNDQQTETASRSGHFYYSPSDHHWRAENYEDTADSYGTDGDGTSNHVKGPWNQCFFTDGEYDGVGTTADGDEVGMNFLMWYAYTGTGRSCELTLID